MDSTQFHPPETSGSAGPAAAAIQPEQGWPGGREELTPLFLPGSSPGDSGNWIEIAYGTSSGGVRVIVQHPETVGSGPQLFQTFTVHRSPVTKIMLSEKHLISGESHPAAPGLFLPARVMAPLGA